MTAMMTPNAPPQPPQHGMVASHLHSLCHNSSLVEAIVLVKVGEGWIQIDDREMLGELVLSSASQHLRKVIKLIGHNSFIVIFLPVPVY